MCVTDSIGACVSRAQVKRRGQGKRWHQGAYLRWLRRLKRDAKALLTIRRSRQDGFSLHSIGQSDLAVCRINGAKRRERRGVGGTAVRDMKEVREMMVATNKTRLIAQWRPRAGVVVSSLASRSARQLRQDANPRSMRSGSGRDDAGVRHR